MRNLILELSNSIAFLFAVLFFVPQMGHSQDLLVTKVGDSVNCQKYRAGYGAAKNHTQPTHRGDSLRYG